MLDSDAYQITWLVRRLFRAMGENANVYLESLGISAAERAVMEFLYKNETVTVPDISRRYNVSRQHIQVTVNRLKKKGLVLISDNPQHKRSSLISLSAKGKTLFKKVLIKDEKAIKRALSGISIDKQRTTREVLQWLVNKLKKGE